MFLNRDRKYILLIFLYCLIFLILRLFASINAFTFDEAEQLFDSQHYYLGYADQPPLFSWIIKTLSLIFGLSIPLMMVITHLLIFIFFITVYFICQKVWNEKQSFIITASLVFVFLYSYDFYRYMIHSILMTTIAAITLLIYLNLLENDSIKNYFLLGVCMACGILAKYNFIFFIAALILSSLSFKTGRKVFFAPKNLISIFTALLLLLPHAYWLTQNNFSSFNYALERSQAGSHNMGVQDFLKILWLGFWNHILFVLIFLSFFYSCLSEKLPDALVHRSLGKDERLIKALRLIAVYSILVPIAAVLILQSNNLTNRWLAALYFPFILGLFTFVDFNKFQRYKIYLISIAILILGIYGVKIVDYFFPDYYGFTFIHTPYKAIYQDFEAKLKEQGIIDQSITEVNIYSFREKNIIAGIKLFYPHARLKIMRKKFSKIARKEKNILIYNPKKFKQKTIEQELNRKQIHFKNTFLLKAKYLHTAKNEDYKIKVMEIY